MGTVVHTDFLSCADQGAVPAHVTSADTSEVPTYAGSSDIGFSVVGSSKLTGVSLLASTMIPDASGMANG